MTAPARQCAARIYTGNRYVDVRVTIDGDGIYTIVGFPMGTRRALKNDVRAQVERENEFRRNQVHADQRAKALLLRMLTETQRATFDAHQYIDVTTEESGRVYRIDCNAGYSGNIRRLKKNTDTPTRHSYCVYPGCTWGEYAPPTHDMFLGQLLLLRTDEKTFLEVAHRYTD